jgi:hypothetical protein
VLHVSPVQHASPGEPQATGTSEGTSAGTSATTSCGASAGASTVPSILASTLASALESIPMLLSEVLVSAMDVSGIVESSAPVSIPPSGPVVPSELASSPPSLDSVEKTLKSDVHAAVAAAVPTNSANAATMRNAGRVMEAISPLEIEAQLIDPQEGFGGDGSGGA